jgi:hypothetical protein
MLSMIFSDFISFRQRKVCLCRLGSCVLFLLLFALDEEGVCLMNRALRKCADLSSLSSLFFSEKLSVSLHFKPKQSQPEKLEILEAAHLAAVGNIPGTVLVISSLL